MLKVFFTIDVEIWCDGWDDLDEKFPAAFERYIYGKTTRGHYGLPYQTSLFSDHGIHPVYFVEPLFTLRFGIQPLQEIVGLIEEKQQEIQLHLHPEWVDESPDPVLDTPGPKRPYLFQYSLPEQSRLVGIAQSILKRAGVGEIEAFRAGSYGLNRDTISALAENGIRIDSSCNATRFGPESGICSPHLLQPARHGEVWEYPVTVFRDGMNSLRHLQLTACSFREMTRVFWKAAESGCDSVVLVSHSFELLNRQKNRPDPVVVERFRKLCSFLERNSDVFQTRGFSSLDPPSRSLPTTLHRVSVTDTVIRYAEQLARKGF